MNVLINVSNNPIIIVGQNPGRQRGGVTEKVCWQNNQSADLLCEAIKGRDNIILTNVCQYRDMTLGNLKKGVEDLERLIKEVKPRKVISLGTIASIKVLGILLDNPSFRVISLHHPSYVVRFNNDRTEWINKLIGEL